MVLGDQVEKTFIKWEEDLLSELHQLLAGIHLKPECSYTVKCNLNNSGLFTVKSFLEKAYSYVY